MHSLRPLLARNWVALLLIAYALAANAHSVLTHSPLPWLSSGLALAAAAVLLAVIKASAETRRYVLSLVLSLVLGVAALEGALQWLATAPVTGHGNARETMRVKRLEAEGRSFDTRDRFQVVADARARGRDLWPAAMPKMFTSGANGAAAAGLHPLGGMPGVETVVCNEAGYHLVYRADRYGFNNPDAVWDRPEPKVVLVGDSYGQGQCVHPGDSLADRLRAAVPATVNIAMGGNSPLVEMGALKEYGGLAPLDVVFWLYFEGNDLSGLLVERDDPLLLRYMEPDFRQNLPVRSGEVAALVRAMVDAKAAEKRRGDQGVQTAPEARIRFGRMLKLGALQAALSAKLRERELQRESLQLMADILVEARRFVESRGGRLVFVYLPGANRTFPDEGPLSWEQLARDNVLASARTAGLDVIDLLPPIVGDADPPRLYPLRLPGHFAEQGHALAARALTDYLMAHSAGRRYSLH